MSELSDYLLGQIHSQLGQQQQTLHSLTSEQAEQGEKLETIHERINEAYTWGQRIAWMVIALSLSLVLNVWPEKLGEVLAQVLKAKL